MGIFKRSQEGNFKYKPRFRRHQKIVIGDWAKSSLKKQVDNGSLAFNEDRDPTFFREDEVDYMIHLLRYSTKDFTTLELIKPPFNKALSTLDKLMTEL